MGMSGDWKWEFVVTENGGSNMGVKQHVVFVMWSLWSRQKRSYITYIIIYIGCLEGEVHQEIWMYKEPIALMDNQCPNIHK